MNCYMWHNDMHRRLLIAYLIVSVNYKYFENNDGSSSCGMATGLNKEISIY